MIVIIADSMRGKQSFELSWDEHNLCLVLPRMEWLCTCDSVVISPLGRSCSGSVCPLFTSKLCPRAACMCLWLLHIVADPKSSWYSKGRGTKMELNTWLGRLGSVSTWMGQINQSPKRVPLQHICRFLAMLFMGFCDRSVDWEELRLELHGRVELEDVFRYACS